MTEHMFSLDFSKLPTEPLYMSEVVNYIKSNLKLSQDVVKAIYNPGKKVYVKVTTPEVLEHVFDSFDNKLTYTDKHANTVKVKLTNESEIKTVKIDVPLDVSQCDVELALSFYGKVCSITSNEEGNNLPNDSYKDIRVVEMKLFDFIPASIIIAGKPYNVKYAGQPKTTREETEVENQSLNQEDTDTDRY